MATDMMTMINRKLAEMERAKGGASTTPYLDIVSETMRYAKEDKMLRERKNLQMQKMMDLQVEGYKTNFTTGDIQKKHDRLDAYINKNSRSMNQITLEYADVLRQNVGDHRDKIVKFREDVDMFESTKDDWMQKADDYFARGEALNDKDYDDIQGSIDDYVRMKNEIIENNADFLGLPQFKHVLTNMVGQEAVINDLLAEAKDQQVFTEYEHKYLTTALQTGNYKIIEDERAKKKVLTGEYMKNQVADIAPVYNRNELLKALERGDSITSDGTLFNIPEGTIFSKSDFDDFDIDDKMLLDEVEDSGENLNRLNKIYRTSTGDDYIVARGGTPSEKHEWDDEELKIFKEHFGMTGDEIELLSPSKGSEKLDEYGNETGDPNFQTNDDKNVDSNWDNVATGLAAGYFVGKATGANQKIADVSKFVLDETKKGMKYVNFVAKEVPLEDINRLINDPVVQGALDDLDVLKNNMDEALEKGEYSKEYKKAKRAYNAKARQHAKALRSGGRIKITYDPKGGLDPKTGKPFKKTGQGKVVTSAIKNIKEKELIRLLTNPGKWNTMKLKRHVLQTVPGLAKGWRAFVPGGGFASFELGRRATKEFAETFMGEGLGAEITGVAGGAATQKYIYSKAKKKIADKLATAAGRRWLVQKLAIIAGKRVASSTITGLAAGGGTPASIATGVIGAAVGLGMAAWDIKELFFDEGEE